MLMRINKLNDIVICCKCVGLFCRGNICKEIIDRIIGLRVCI